MLAESNVRSRYLSLALDARKIIDVLVLYVKKADNPLQAALLGKVVDSLNTLGDRERLFSSADRTSLFGDYERMRTLGEVKDSFPQHDIARQLADVLRTDLAPDERKRNAEQAIQFFCALEGRALERYTQAMDM